MVRSTLMLSSLLSVACGVGAAQASVHVQPPKVEGPRVLQPQTAATVIQDYVESWQSLHAALAQNRPDLLDRDFIGTEKAKLSETIQQQAKLGLRTTYTDRAHDIQIVFYSPEGLSIELVDNAEYDVQVMDHDKPLATQHMKARYVVVMTPTEVRWRVRLMQAQPE